MASRIFTHRLLLSRQSTATSSSFLNPLRHFSAKADAIAEPNLDASATKPPEQLSPMLSVFEDLIHGMIVQRCEPDWIPFVPGSSFWVPPRPKSGSFIKEIEKLTVVNRPLSDDETMSLTTMRGWPSSAFLLQGNEVDLMKSKTEDEQDKDTNDSVLDASSREDKKD